MNITAPFGDGCLGGEPLIVTVEDCGADLIHWTFLNGPEGAADPTVRFIDNVNNVRRFSITATVAGSYTIEAECCG